jgi:hypothetical protein
MTLESRSTENVNIQLVSIQDSTYEDLYRAPDLRGIICNRDGQDEAVGPYKYRRMMRPGPFSPCYLTFGGVRVSFKITQFFIVPIASSPRGVATNKGCA